MMGYLKSFTNAVRLHYLPHVDWCYLAVLARKLTLKTLFRITTLTGVDGKLQGQEKNMFSTD